MRGVAMNLVPFKNKRRNIAEAEPASQLARFRNEMDRLFDRYVRGAVDWDVDGPIGDQIMQGGPTLDVAETEGEIGVKAELPGVDSKDLNVSVAGDVLTISGEKKTTSEQKGENFHRTERRFGSFERMIQLPAEVYRESVNAEF